MGPREPLDYLEVRVDLDLRDLLDNLGRLVLLVGQVLADRGVILDLRVYEGILDPAAHLDKRDRLVHLDSRDSPDPVESRDEQASLVNLDSLEGKVHRDRLAREDRQGLLDPRVVLGHRAILDNKDLLGCLEEKVLLDSVDQLETVAGQVCRYHCTYRRHLICKIMLYVLLVLYHLCHVTFNHNLATAVA